MHGHAEALSTRSWLPTPLLVLPLGPLRCHKANPQGHLATRTFPLPGEGELPRRKEHIDMLTAWTKLSLAEATHATTGLDGPPTAFGAPHPSPAFAGASCLLSIPYQ